MRIPPRVAPCGWVAPFGDPGINDRSHLPRAFRSVPRPSSPLSAKASTRCPSFALDHKERPPRRMTHKITRTASRPPENRRAQGQAPPSRERGATLPAAARMKTLLRTAPRTGSHPTGQQPHRTASQCRGPSASVTFTNPLHPSINTSPGTPAAGAGHARPAAPEPEPNLVFSEHLVIGDASIAGVGASGGERDRTDDLLLAKQALSQLSYTPRARDQRSEPRDQNGSDL